MKKPIELANELVTYGLYDAGADETPEQKEWGADCVEAAILLFNITGEKRLRVCDQFLDAFALKTLAKELRTKADKLRAERDMKANQPTKKQARIIFYATDQSASCIDEETKENPFKDMVEAERAKGNYYGLSTLEYRKLCDKNGYEWVEIHHNGDYGTNYVAKSENYEFNEWETEHEIEIGDTVFWNGRIEKKRK